MEAVKRIQGQNIYQHYISANLLSDGWTGENKEVKSVILPVNIGWVHEVTLYVSFNPSRPDMTLIARRIDEFLTEREKGKRSYTHLEVYYAGNLRAQHEVLEEKRHIVDKEQIAKLTKLRIMRITEYPKAGAIKVTAFDTDKMEYYHFVFMPPESEEATPTNPEPFKQATR